MGPRVTAVPNDSERRCQERRRKHRRLEQAPLTVPNNETESDSDSDDDDDDEDEDFEPTNYQPPTINRSAPSAAAIRLLSAGASRATAIPAAVVQTAPCFVQANNGGAAVQLPAAEARELAEAAALAEAQWREEQATESAATGVVMASNAVDEDDNFYDRKIEEWTKKKERAQQIRMQQAKFEEETRMQQAKLAEEQAKLAEEEAKLAEEIQQLRKRV